MMANTTTNKGTDTIDDVEKKSRGHLPKKEDKKETKLVGKKRSRTTDLTDEELREERKAANRRSAFESRLRKKLLIEELQEKVEQYKQQISVVEEDNRRLAMQLESALAENRQLRYEQGNLFSTVRNNLSLGSQPILTPTSSLLMPGGGGNTSSFGGADSIFQQQQLLANIRGVGTGIFPSSASSMSAATISTLLAGGNGLPPADLMGALHQKPNSS